MNYSYDHRIVDPRDETWGLLESEIQKRAPEKDPEFVLGGPWKNFVRFQDGLKVYLVDGTYLRNNLCAYFGHGGHGLVHEFIPMDEIWISTRHYHEGDGKYSKCTCKVWEKNQPISQTYFEHCTLHEIFEFQMMSQGLPYWQAHNMAINEEKRAGAKISEDSYIDM